MESETSNARDKKPSAFAAFSRALVGTLAFMFKRPIRLFRPVKISTWTGLQAIAEEQGRTVSPAFVRSLMRKEGWRFFPNHILPPLCINTCIGLTLFSSYTISEHYLSQHIPRSLLIPFISGSIAGACQSLLSAPLDNARLLLLRRQRLIRLYGRRPSRLPPHARELSKPFVGWMALLRDAVFASPASVTATLPPLQAGSKSEQRRREVIHRAGQWAKRGWSLWGLSLSKDAMAFGTFFSIFEFGRGVALRVGLKWDGIDPQQRELDLLGVSDWRDGEINFDVPDEDEPVEKRKRRSATSLGLQGFLILVAGGLAGYSFSLVTRPFERARGAIWEGRARWAEMDGRAKVAEEVANRSEPEAFWRKRKKGWVLRKRVKRVGRRRGVGRTFAMARRRQEKERIKKERAERRRSRSTLGNVVDTEGPTSTEESVSSAVAFHEVQPTRTRQPLPSAFSLVHLAAKRHGPLTFFLAPLPVLQHKIAAQGSSMKPTKKIPGNVGPTRLSMRGKQAREMAEKGGRRFMRGATKVLAFLPPYSIGLLVYALMSGDLT